MSTVHSNPDTAEPVAQREAREDHRDDEGTRIERDAYVRSDQPPGDDRENQQHGGATEQREGVAGEVPAVGTIVGKA